MRDWKLLPLCLLWFGCDAWIVAPPPPLSSYTNLHRHEHRRPSAGPQHPIRGSVKRSSNLHLLPEGWADAIASTSTTISEDSDLPIAPAFLLVLALTLGVAANGWIQKLLQGDQGLGSYLSDGSGFQKSGFRSVRSSDERAVSSDPLPWLQLPELDFVEVAGQEQQKKEDFERDAGQQDVLLTQLERLRLEKNNKRQKGTKGQAEDAEQIQRELEH